MATNHAHHAHGDSNPSVAFERQDLGARGILVFFAVLAISAVVIHVLVLGMYVGMTRYSAIHDPEMNPQAPAVTTPQPGFMQNASSVNIQQFPEPRLQANDVNDMNVFLEKEERILKQQPWKDEQGNVHLPIDQAMKAVTTRLNARQGGAPLPLNSGAGREYSGVLERNQINQQFDAPPMETGQHPRGEANPRTSEQGPSKMPPETDKH